jgi:N-acetylmuramoyl-L-alanine amidase
MVRKELCAGRRAAVAAAFAGEGFPRIMTREGDYFVPLEVGPDCQCRDSIFVSIHFNATDRDPSATGFEIFHLRRAERPQRRTTG